MPSSAFTTVTAAIGSSTMPPFIVTASEAAVTTVPSTASAVPVPDCDDYPAYLNKCHVASCAAVIMQIHN